MQLQIYHFAPWYSQSPSYENGEPLINTCPKVHITLTRLLTDYMLKRGSCL